MANQEIGGLRISLSASSAEFKADLQKAAKHSVDFEKQLLGVAKTVGTAWASMFASSSVVDAIKNVVSESSKLGKAAESIGTTAESLSALKYAAEAMGVPFENLQQAMGKLANLSTDAQNQLKAMGISFRDAKGNMLPTEELLKKLADAFAGYADGSGKAKAAIQIFGDELGAKMIPLLNKGSDGIAKLKDEAAKAGAVLSGDAVKAAKAFEEQMRKLSATGESTMRNFILPFLPALTSLTEKLNEVSLAWAGAFKRFGSADQSPLQIVARQITETQASREKIRGQMVETENWIADLRHKLDELKRDAETAAVGPQGMPGGPNDPRKDMPNPGLLEGWKAEVKDFRSEVESAGVMLQQFLNPSQSYEQTFDKITAAFAKGSVSAAEYAAAIARLNELNNQMSFDNAISSVGNFANAMSQLFQKQKGIAIAAAIIDSAGAFTKALNNPPGPPWWYINAAAALASGMAKVQMIRSTNPGSSGGGGGGTSVPSVGAPAAAAAPAAAPATERQAVNLHLQSHSFSRGQVKELMEQINGLVSDGAILRVA